MLGRFRRRTTVLLLSAVLAAFAASAVMAIPPACQGARCYKNGALVGAWYSCPDSGYHWWGQCDQTSGSNWVYFDACAAGYCSEALNACVQQPLTAPEIETMRQILQ
jgi:hypothetical protein